jgi:hypothetical protein
VVWSPELMLFAAVAIGGGVSLVMTSPDGISWTDRDQVSGTTGWRSVVWADISDPPGAFWTNRIRTQETI